MYFKKICIASCTTHNVFKKNCITDYITHNVKGAENITAGYTIRNIFIFNYIEVCVTRKVKKK